MNYAQEALKTGLAFSPEYWAHEMQERHLDVLCEWIVNILKEQGITKTTKEIAAFHEKSMTQRGRRRKDNALSKVVQEYNTKILPVPLPAERAKGKAGIKLGGAPNDKVFMGAELEVCVKETGLGIAAAARVLEDINGDFRFENLICVHDGSTFNQNGGGDEKYPYGFEFVTRPLNPIKLQKMLRDILVHKESFVPHTTCGFHIHASRAAMSPAQIGRINYFIGDERNRDFVIAMARREPSETYCKIVKKTTASGAKIDTYDRCKYEAVNNGNLSTVEFRIFASSLDIDILCAHVQFVRSLIEWSKNQSLDEKNLTWKNYVVWLENKPHIYRYATIKKFIRKNVNF